MGPLKQCLRFPNGGCSPPLDQASRPLRNHHGAGIGKALQAGGKIRRLADHTTLLSFAAADQIANHDQTGRDTHRPASLTVDRGCSVVTALTSFSAAMTARSASFSRACG